MQKLDLQAAFRALDLPELRNTTVAPYKQYDRHSDASTDAHGLLILPILANQMLQAALSHLHDQAALKVLIHIHFR